jgi:hypothetical protein
VHTRSTPRSAAVDQALRRSPHIGRTAQDASNTDAAGGAPVGGSADQFPLDKELKPAVDTAMFEGKLWAAPFRTPA